VAYLAVDLGSWDPSLIVPAAAAMLGLLHALLLRLIRPVIYAGIGQAGVPVVVTARTPKVPKPREPGAHRAEQLDGQPKNS
jgi:hypothetical protein